MEAARIVGEQRARTRKHIFRPVAGGGMCSIESLSAPAIAQKGSLCHLRSLAYFFFGARRSVMVPSNISAANATVSDRVGCGCTVRPMLTLRGGQPREALSAGVFDGRLHLPQQRLQFAGPGLVLLLV